MEKKVLKVVKFINENFLYDFQKILFIKGFICAHIRNYFRQPLLKELRFITHYIIFYRGGVHRLVSISQDTVVNKGHHW